MFNPIVDVNPILVFSYISHTDHLLAVGRLWAWRHWGLVRFLMISAYAYECCKYFTKIQSANTRPMCWPNSSVVTLNHMLCGVGDEMRYAFYGYGGLLLSNSDGTRRHQWFLCAVFSFIVTSTVKTLGLKPFPIIKTTNNYIADESWEADTFSPRLRFYLV